MSLDDDNLSSLIRGHATRHAAPEHLRAAIRTHVALAEAGRPTRPASRLPMRWLAGLGGRATGFSGWRQAFAGFAIGIACAWVALPLAPRLGGGEPADSDFVASHVRAMGAGPLTEVISTDRHTVKPWFQGRIDFAPPVFDLAADGFPLVGGRIDHVRSHAAATLVYASRQHVIDVFVRPDNASRPLERVVDRGFNVLHWADGSMQYWAVSDLDRTELERFARLWQARAAAQ
jgi:anti-sigma factor RsiW